MRSMESIEESLLKMVIIEHMSNPHDPYYGFANYIWDKHFCAVSYPLKGEKEAYEQLWKDPSGVVHGK